MNDYIKAQLDTYIEVIKRGAKPASVLPIQNRYVQEAITILEESQLCFKVENSSEGWKYIWIYKNPELRKTINEIT